jgi:hypothetical protein
MNSTLKILHAHWYVLDLSGSGYGPVERSCEHGNEPSGTIKYWEILEQLSDWLLDYQLLTLILWYLNWQEIKTIYARF